MTHPFYVIFATGNEGKYWHAVHEFSRYKFGGVGLLRKQLNLPETEKTVVDIAVQKVIEAFRQLRQPVFSLDGGFYINAFNGQPGVFCNPFLNAVGIEGIVKTVNSKRPFAFPGTINLQNSNIETVLNFKDPRACYFLDALAYMDSTLTQPKIFVSERYGFIADKPKGLTLLYAWSDLWKIFIPCESKKTLAEMTNQEFQDYSSKEPFVFRDFFDWLKGYLN